MVYLRSLADIARYIDRTPQAVRKRAERLAARTYRRD